MLLNKGNSNLNNKIDQINHLISIHNPDFFSLNELNLEKYDSISPNQFPGYKLECDNLAQTDTCARSGVLIKEEIEYKRRKDLECEGLSTVWIQIKTREKKTIFVTNFLLPIHQNRYTRNLINNQSK